MEIELALVEAVGSAEFHVRSGDFETQLGEIDGATGHAKFSGKSGDHVFDVGIFGVPLTLAAEGINLFLHAWAGEMGVGHAELSVNGHALNDVAVPFSDNELGGDLGVAVHNGLVVLDRQIQQVLDARGAGNHVEQDRSALFGRHVSHFSVDHERRMSKVRDNRFQDDVAICTINDRRVVGVQRNLMAADVQAEVGSIRGALDVQKIERAAKFARRRKRTFKPLDRAHVCVLKGKFGVNRRVAWLVGLPRAKFADTVDCTARNGIGQLSVKRRGIVEAEIVNQKLLDGEIARRLLGIIAQNRNQPVGRVDFLDQNRIFLGQINIGTANSGTCPATLRRNVNLQAIQLNIFYGVLLSQYVGKARGE